MQSLGELLQSGVVIGDGGYLIELERQYFCGIQGRADYHRRLAHFGARRRVGDDYRDELRIEPG